MATAQLGTLLRHIHQLAAGRGDEPRTDRQLLNDFAARRDEAAFAALLARHGAMVLRVCRRVLHHEQDAEDAFQATFLVLARHTGSIRKRDTLGNWLHGVAYRTAMKAKRSAARRRNHEARLRAVAPQTAAGPIWDETQAVLDEEIQRLPVAFRAAFVLCVLEGKSTAEAAGELGCKEGTVRSRVSRARRLLQRQLARRGIKLAVLLAALSVAESATRAALPTALARATIRFGLLVAAGSSAAGVIPAQVAALAAGVTRAMSLTQAKTTTAVLLAVSLLTAAGAWTHQALGAREMQAPANALPTPGKPEQPAAAEKPKALAAEAPDEAVTYGGRVLDPDGKPVAGAKLFLTLPWVYVERPAPCPVYATTGADGRFRFAVPKSRFKNYQATVLAATAQGYGVAWVDVDLRDKKDKLVLRLAKDDVPVAGRMVDLQGRPVAGATIRVLHIKAAPAGNPVADTLVRVLDIKAAPAEGLDPWLKAVRGKEAMSPALEQKYFNRQLMSPEVPDLPHEVATDAAGRFRLAGVGRDRLVTLRVSGPAIATQELHILTRPGRPIEVPEATFYPDGKTASVTTYYGADFQHVTGPTKPIIGIVRDKDTRRPLPGVTIQSDQLANRPVHGIDFVRTTTDEQGRYRLTGMPKGNGNKIVAVPGGNQPYLPAHAEAADTPGLDPVTVDFELKRGVWVEGRVTDKATGKPLQASVAYFALGQNPHLRDYPGYKGTISGNNSQWTKEDGLFRVVALPGPGIVAVQYTDRYLLAQEREDEYGTQEPVLNTIPYAVVGVSYNAFARIDPPKGAGSVKRDVVLDPGETFTGTVLGPDGKPLAGARASGLTGWGIWYRTPLETAAFTVRAFNPRRPRPVL